MNICLLRYKSPSSKSINDVMENSLLDLGHKLVEHADAEIVIAIRDFSKVERKYSDKKYILFQIEQYKSKQGEVNSYYNFKPDEVWGFDIDNKKEIYTPLGYHPCLKFESQLLEDIDVSFLGWFTGRRKIWFGKVRNKWVLLNTFTDKIRGENISRTRINLNIHFYDYENVVFTEWGRISYFLANNCFFISEKFHCPIKIPQFSSYEKYDKLVEYYLKNSKLRIEEGCRMGWEYKEEYDMRDILKRRI